MAIFTSVLGLAKLEEHRLFMEMTKFHRIDQLEALRVIATDAREPVVALLLPLWKMRSQPWGNQLSMFASLANSFNLERVYTVYSHGSDEVESYVIDTLNMQDFPVVVIYDGSFGLVYNELLERALQSGSLQFALRSTLIKAYNRNVPVDRNILRYFDSDIKIGTVFVSGDRSSVGKSSICLGFLKSLVDSGVDPSKLAYIKPVTQCEAEQLVTIYCQQVGIAHCGIGPVVFYKGFTRAYLQGGTDSSLAMLENVRLAVEAIGRGKSLVLVDGVGYPSVGSICNISNAHVAKVLGTPVVLIGKPGVGDAVDSHNLNSAFFESFQVRVLGAIFNKLALEGFYGIEACKESVSDYFRQYRQDQKIYGFIPQVAKVETDSELKEFQETFSRTFSSSVDVYNIIRDVFYYHIHRQLDPNFTIINTIDNTQVLDNSMQCETVSNTAQNTTILSPKRVIETLNESMNMNTSIPTMASLSSQPSPIMTQQPMEYGRKRSRYEIEAMSLLQGAKLGG